MLKKSITKKKEKKKKKEEYLVQLVVQFDRISYARIIDSRYGKVYHPSKAKIVAVEGNRVR